MLTGVDLLYHLAAMDTQRPLPQASWERTPAEGQEYIRVLAARVAVLEAMIARGGQSQGIGAAVRAQARRMFPWWHRGRDGTLAQARFASSRRPVRREVERVLAAGQTCGVPKTEGMWWELLKRRHPGVEPTHNAAERAMRPGVLWRKGSSGTHSADGSRFVEARMTVVATRKPPHRTVLDDLTAACEAAQRGEAAPSLLPTPDMLRERVRPAA